MNSRPNETGCKCRNVKNTRGKNNPVCSIQDLAGCSDSMTVAVTTTQNNCSVFTQSAKSDNLINLENNLQCQAEVIFKQIVQNSMPVNLRLNMKFCLRLLII